MIDTSMSLGPILISPMMFGISAYATAASLYRTIVMQVLLPLRQISDDGSGDTMLQSTMTETMAVRMTLVLQLDH